MQKRGRGYRYSAPSFKYKGKAKHLPGSIVKGHVEKLVHCLGHSAPLMQIKTAENERFLMIAPRGIAVGDEISYEATEPSVGQNFRVKDLPDGTIVYNVELRPGDGGKFARASGTSARIVTKTDAGKVVVLLPSKKKTTIHPECRATIGIVAGGGRPDKPFYKAGTRYHRLKKRRKIYPKVSGSAMNALDHPFGNSRSLRKSKARPAPKNAPVGRKVGMLRPKRTGRKK